MLKLKNNLSYFHGYFVNNTHTYVHNAYTHTQNNHDAQIINLSFWLNYQLFAFTSLENQQAQSVSR